MPFGPDIYGNYIYSSLTVTHARRAFRHPSCWLGVIYLTLGCNRYMLNVVDTKPEDFRRISPVIRGGLAMPGKGFFGHHTEETKAKISESRKGKALGNTNAMGHEPWNKGKRHSVHTEEWRRKVSAANSGPNHWNWKGGLDSARRLGRNTTERKEWTRAVIEKDGHVCTHCGTTERLLAHHVLDWETHPHLRFDVANGETLCRACHCFLHKPRTGTGKPPKPQPL
jgi:hypothetical protein